jgi:hypothetical protein
MGLNHSPRIATDGLIMCLDVANKKSYDGSATTWGDILGNYDATFENMDASNFSADNLGSFAFDGTNEGMKIPLVGSFQEMTFDFWATFDDPDLSVPTFSTRTRNESIFGDWSSNRQHFGSRWSVGMHWNVNNVWSEVTSLSSLRYGWNHYSLIWNNNANQKLIYINSKLSYQEGTNGPIQSTANNFAIGYAPSLSAYYRGNISNFKIYDKALGAEQVSQNYQATVGRYV